MDLSSRLEPRITGVLSGFDRLVFRGTLIPLVRERGMFCFLQRARVRLLDFRAFEAKTSEALKRRILAQTAALGRPHLYVSSTATSKEGVAREVLAKCPVDQGLVCTLTSVEPCMTFDYHRSRDPHERGLRRRPGRCLHVYQYRLHPVFGFMSARLQTWFPFDIQVCLNGREWLARQLDRRAIGFGRQDNCFTWVDDVDQAQRLMNKQLETDWSGQLRRIARLINPLHDRLFRAWPMDYYWAAYQTEWATDTMFANPRALDEVYPPLVDHAMNHFRSPDVLRFLGKKAHGNFTGELVTSFKDRAEGVRVKHYAAGNSIKMYDKAGSHGRSLKGATYRNRSPFFEARSPPPTRNERARSVPPTCGSDPGRRRPTRVPGVARLVARRHPAASDRENWPCDLKIMVMGRQRAPDRDHHRQDQAIQGPPSEG